MLQNLQPQQHLKRNSEEVLGVKPPEMAKQLWLALCKGSTVGWTTATDKTRERVKYASDIP